MVSKQRIWLQGRRLKKSLTSQLDKIGISPRHVKAYTFKDDIIDTWFQLLEKSGKLKLLEIRRLDELGKVRDPNY